MIEVDTPGFLITKKTAKILETVAPRCLIDPLLVCAKKKKELGNYWLSRGYDENGRVMEMTRETRGMHQAYTDYEMLEFNEWFGPIVKEYADQNFFTEDRVLIKSQEYYLWYDVGVGVSLHADDSSNGSCNTPHRVITVLMYLNNDYTGGEISFPSHGVFKKPLVGEILIFPGNRLFKHAVAPITSGNRYAVMQSYDLPINQPCCGQT